MSTLFDSALSDFGLLNSYIFYSSVGFSALLLVLTIVVSIFLTQKAESRSKSYYYGDAINYNGRLIIGSTNMGEGELFELVDNELVKRAHFQSIKDLLTKQDEFFDIAFQVDSGRLYAYLVDGRRLYKYDATDITNPRLVKNVVDNSWDWFMGVEVNDDKIITTGPKMVKVWTNDFIVIDSFQLKSLRQGNIKLSQGRNYIFEISKDVFNIFDTRTRGIIAEKIIVAMGEHNRIIYNDEKTGMIYLVDDEALKKIDFAGNVQNIFYHISDVGYDVAGLDNRSYIYFSDGIGIVKSSKADLEPISWSFTPSLAAPDGWAIGLVAVAQGSSDKVIVFNNSSIIVFDENLEMIDYYESIEEELGPREMLFLAVDKDRAAAGSLISLRGGGYGVSEELDIRFESLKESVQTDKDGRFVKIMTVPEVIKPPIKTDIKVIGKNTSLTYSISFLIE